MQKTIIALLMLAALAFSNAPSWVGTGANLTYSVGNDHINYYVTSSNASDVFIVKTNLSSSHSYNLDEDATQATDNAFWFDNNLLAAAYTGGMVNGMTVASTGSQQFQGQTITTVTLTQDYGGGVTGTFIYDQKTGLLFSAVISGAAVPSVTLVSAIIPGVPAYAPPAPAPPTPPPPQQNNSTPPPAQNNSAPPPSGGQGSTPNSTTPAYTPPSPSQPSTPSNNYSGVQVYPKNSSCCLSSLIIGFVAVVAVGYGTGRKRS